MAAADYYLCDVCSSKCFYDSNLNWENTDIPEDRVRGTSMSLDYCGDMACICKDCAKTHLCKVVKISEEN